MAKKEVRLTSFSGGQPEEMSGRERWPQFDDIVKTRLPIKDITLDLTKEDLILYLSKGADPKAIVEHLKEKLVNALEKEKNHDEEKSPEKDAQEENHQTHARVPDGDLAT